MPSTYAHYRFGKDVLSLLSKEYKQLVPVSYTHLIGFENFDSSREALVADGIMFRKDALPSVDFEP